MSRKLFDDFLRGKEVEDSNDGDSGPDSLSSSGDSYTSDDQADDVMRLVMFSGAPEMG